MMTIEQYIERILGRLRALEGDDPAKRRMLTLLGISVQSRAKAIVTEKRMIDRGLLRSSIAFRIKRRGDMDVIEAGPYGVGYANFVERGAEFTWRNVLAMRRKGIPKRPSKNVVRGNIYPARSFMWQSVLDTRERNLDIVLDWIREILREESR